MAEQNRSRLETTFNGAEIQRLLADLKHKAGLTTEAVTEVNEEIPDEFDRNTLANTVLTSINCRGEVKEQKVRVMYLTTAQNLRIPAGLAMNPSTPAASEATHDTDMIERYWKVARMTYAEIKALLETQETAVQKRDRVDAIAPVPDRAAPQKWNEDTFFTTGVAVPDATEFQDYVFALISRILRMNFDIRDMGFLVLVLTEARAADNEWMNVDNQTISRLESKLHAFSLHCIAGLNLEACGNWPLGAWVRAFGVSAGILPNPGTKLTKEWRYVKVVPKDDTLTRVTAVYNTIGPDLQTLCLNIIAMFGLFHLNKNHTFKTGDANMERICMSFIMTLRTMFPGQIVDDMKAHMEIVCRTAAHPFGLGQTYWTALLLKRGSALASPLALRVDVSPPAVMRYHIVDVAMKEWSGFPVGNKLRALFSETASVVAAQVARIKQCAPAYSELYQLYGLDAEGEFEEGAKDAADSLMPIVYGYARATHITEGNKKDGLGYALSLDNVDSTSKVIAQSYEQMWKNYVGAMDTGGLEEFVHKSFASRYGRRPR